MKTLFEKRNMASMTSQYCWKCLSNISSEEESKTCSHCNRYFYGKCTEKKSKKGKVFYQDGTCIECTKSISRAKKLRWFTWLIYFSDLYIEHYQLFLNSSSVDVSLIHKLLHFITQDSRVCFIFYICWSLSFDEH